MSPPPTSPPVLVVVLLLVLITACSKPASVPETTPADRPLIAALSPRDASVDLPRDAQPDVPPDGAGSAAGHAHAHRIAQPRPAADGFKVSGGIGRADAETVLRAARGKLQACYQKAHAQTPDLKGRVTFRLSIDGRGRVPLAEVVSSTLGGGDPELCMVEALRDLKFPPSPSGAESTLTFPMTFVK